MKKGNIMRDVISSVSLLKMLLKSIKGFGRYGIGSNNSADYH